MPLRRILTLEQIRLRFLNMLDQKTGNEKRVLRKYILMMDKLIREQPEKLPGKVHQKRKNRQSP